MALLNQITKPIGLFDKKLSLRGKVLYGELGIIPLPHIAHKASHGGR